MVMVHISADYPDAFASGKTRAITNLLALTEQRFDNLVYSLNRVAPTLRDLFAATDSRRRGAWVDVADRSGGVTTLRYVAPGKGVFLKTCLDKVADFIASDLDSKGIRPALLHGHKLTIEGIVVERLAARLRVPFVLSIQGNTDTKILAVRRDLIPLYRRIFHAAAAVFPFSPWALNAVEERLGRRTGRTVALPVPTSSDAIIAPQPAVPRLLSAFQLAHHRSKNAASLFEASRIIERQVPGYSLDILGEGSERVRQELEAQISRRGLSSVRLAGAVAHDRIQQAMNKAAGFVLVSHRETFGMVFVEALLAGCPVIYPKDRAIDGFFEGCDFAIPVSPGDQAAITSAMLHLIHNQDRLKKSLADWQASGAAARFQRHMIAAAYIGAVDGVMRSPLQ